jgi:hypothetical protein
VPKFLRKLLSAVSRPVAGVGDSEGAKMNCSRTHHPCNNHGKYILRPSMTVGLCVLALAGAIPSLAHNVEARYIESIPWHKEHFSRVFAVGYSMMGLDLDVSVRAKMVTIENRSCVVANLIAFDVDDQYAFDIDEPVDVTLTYAPAFTTAPIEVVWDKNGGIGRGSLTIDSKPGAIFRTVTVTLDRARFAGLGTQKADFAVGSSQGEEVGSARGNIALCDIAISRKGKTKAASTPGRVRIEIRDADSGALLPARVGLYDPTGRAPLPSDQALLVERFADKVRLLPIESRAFWPSANRVGFYVTGIYEAEVPPGTYEIAATHGPEFRADHETIDVRSGQTTNVVIRLRRYLDLPGQGWFSGDDHIHLARDKTRDMTVWTMVAAEDVHLGNLLQMGNITGTYFEQPAWGPAGRFEHDGYTIASGQEDPRTGQLGHTIEHNLQKPIHLSQDSYFLYSHAFDETHRQGGLTGYAHLNGPWFNVHRGLALDVPFGAVDFVEVLQAGKLVTEDWYDFLNLGFKLIPSAGSDFPYTDLPGVVRTYVKLEAGGSADAWFASFRAGHAYVTNGPFLNFTVNGRQMGEEIHVKRGAQLDILAKAQLNPDVDTLDRLELVVLGDVVATEPAGGQDHAQLDSHLTADHSMWIAVRAYGGRHEEWNTTVAHSAPVYVVVDDQPTWKKEALAQLVEKERNHLQGILTAPLIPSEDLEAFDTGKLLLEQWPKQRLLLKPRIEKADAIYQRILNNAPVSH